MPAPEGLPAPLYFSCGLLTSGWLPILWLLGSAIGLPVRGLKASARAPLVRKAYALSAASSS